MENALKKLKNIDREIQLLTRTSALLGWDQETYMPPKGIEGRSEQLALLEGIIHAKIVNPATGELFDKLGASDTFYANNDSLSIIDRSFIKNFFRKYKRTVCLPEKLVTTMVKESSIAQAVWAEARKKSDFSSFAPNLKTLLELVKEKAERIGYREHIYDALIDEFEPWITTAEIKEVFSGLRTEISDLLKKISVKKEIDDSFLLKDFPVGDQDVFCREILGELGWSWDSGRLDLSSHPFSTTIGSGDNRITTRYNKDFFKTGIFGCIHECGHGLYEQGFSDDISDSILGNGASLGIHESQSRTWENLIGRSRTFWYYYFDKLKKTFPKQLEGIDLDQFYRAVNKVEPGFIRVEADEVTYSLHVILRFELELDLLTGNLAVDDLPEAWNSLSRELFGIVPGNDSDGVLQDIHWSLGVFGYFPTYALGNLYGAQFYNTLKKEHPDIEDDFAKGNFSNILNWYREKIHKHGSVYSGGELCKLVTGEKLNSRYYIDYLNSKYSKIYGE